jgi:hypothetical protein
MFNKVVLFSSIIKVSMSSICMIKYLPSSMHLFLVTNSILFFLFLFVTMFFHCNVNAISFVSYLIVNY